MGPVTVLPPCSPQRFNLNNINRKYNMLNSFRILSLIEGASLVILLFIAMPAKYHFGYFDIVWIVGMTHGLLWLAYVALSLPVSHKQNWAVTFWMLVLLASVVPFACLFLDSKLKQELQLARA